MVILSGLHAKMAILDSQQYTLKICLIKYEIDINVINNF